MFFEKCKLATSSKNNAYGGNCRSLNASCDIWVQTTGAETEEHSNLIMRCVGKERGQSSKSPWVDCDAIL